MPTEPQDGPAYTLALRPGTLLDGAYCITDVLRDSSTFAVTDLAKHEPAGDRFVIKEFLPRALAGRASDELTVHPHSASDAAAFARVMRRFKREVELLADIAHPNIPRVRRDFEANGTAYVVFQHYDGRTLSELSAASNGRLPVDRATGFVVQVLQGLEALHAEGIVHGFITPDSVLVDDNSRALILGLGTTRHVVGPAREPVPGFAPIEQYAAKEVGPWTDVYACAALLYRLTTGLVPLSAVERSTGQLMPMPWGSANVPQSLAQTITSALSQLPDARPHSAEEFRRRLEAALTPAASRMLSRADERVNRLDERLNRLDERPSRLDERPNRLEERPSPPRWSAPEVVEPDPIEQLAAHAQLREIDDDASLDLDALLDNTDTPPHSMQRYVRMALGIGGVAAGVLLMFSLLGSRKTENGWVPGDVAAAATPSTNSRATAALEVPRSERSSPPRTETPARVAPIPPSDPLPKPLAPSASRLQRDQAEPAPSPRSAPPRPSTTTARPPVSSAPAPTRTQERVPSVTLSLPSSIGRVEMLPAEVLAGLRERIANGHENAESGEYARAREIYASALDQLAKLSERYSTSQTLQTMKQQIQQAVARASAACAAENEVAVKRNRRPVQCQ